MVHVFTWLCKFLIWPAMESSLIYALKSSIARQTHLSCYTCMIWLFLLYYFSFNKELAEISTIIDERNARRDKKYPYLHPREVPNAISIWTNKSLIAVFVSFSTLGICVLLAANNENIIRTYRHSIGYSGSYWHSYHFTINIFLYLNVLQFIHLLCIIYFMQWYLSSAIVFVSVRVRL